MRPFRFVPSRVAALAAVLVLVSVTGCMEILEQAPSAGLSPSDAPRPSGTTSATVQWRAAHHASRKAHADIASVTYRGRRNARQPQDRWPAPTLNDPDGNGPEPCPASHRTQLTFSARPRQQRRGAV